MRAALAIRGLDVDETDLAVMRVADSIYGPDLRALLAADLAEDWHEPAPDPGRAPAS